MVLPSARNDLSQFMSDKAKSFLIDYDKSSPNVKLPPHRARLAGDMPVKNLVDKEWSDCIGGAGRN